MTDWTVLPCGLKIRLTPIKGQHLEIKRFGALELKGDWGAPGDFEDLYPEGYSRGFSSRYAKLDISMSPENLNALADFFRAEAVVAAGWKRHD